MCYELDLVRNAIVGKMGFLENQMVAREMTNLTPIQLEEFESVFRHFDRDMSNSLQELEFSAALASLGLVYDEDEMHEQFVTISAGKSHVSFEQFIRFMVDITEDQNTAEQVFQSFKEVADGKVCHIRSIPLFLLHYSFINFFLYPSSICLEDAANTTLQPYVTELDLRHSLIPDELVEDLLNSMPQHKGPDLQEDRHLPKYDYVSFMEKMTLGDSEDDATKVNGGRNGH